jgi:hypothetical protein
MQKGQALRDKLRMWEVDNPIQIPVAKPQNSSGPLGQSNPLVNRYADNLKDDREFDTRGTHGSFDNADTVDLRSEATGFKAGDLLEIT